MASKDKDIMAMNADFISRVANTLDDASAAISEIYARRKMNIPKPSAMQMPDPQPMMQPAMPDMPMPDQMEQPQTQAASNPSEAGQKVSDFLNSATTQTSNMPQPANPMPMQSQMPMQSGMQTDTDQQKMAAVQQFSQQTGQDPVTVIQSILSGNLMYKAGEGVIDPRNMGSMPPSM